MVPARVAAPKVITQIIIDSRIPHTRHRDIWMACKRDRAWRRTPLIRQQIKDRTHDAALLHNVMFVWPPQQTRAFNMCERVRVWHTLTSLQFDIGTERKLESCTHTKRIYRVCIWYIWAYQNDASALSNMLPTILWNGGYCFFFVLRREAFHLLRFSTPHKINKSSSTKVSGKGCAQ